MNILTITPAAAERIKQALAKAKEPHKGLRVSVNTKGCSGLAYTVDYADAPKPGDETVEQHGVTLFVDAKAMMFIIGSEMDYVEDKFKSGFEFRNPNEAGRCGCGESFYVDRDALKDGNPK